MRLHLVTAVFSAKGHDRGMTSRDDKETFDCRLEIFLFRLVVSEAVLGVSKLGGVGG